MNCYYNFCPAHDKEGLGNCIHMPPDECIMKKMLDDSKKAVTFVNHIENHLKVAEANLKVVCKICDDDIDTIYEEATSSTN